MRSKHCTHREKRLAKATALMVKPTGSIATSSLFREHQTHALWLIGIDHAVCAGAGASLYTRSTSVPLTLQLDTTEAGGHPRTSAGHPRVRLSLIGPCQHVPPSVLSFTYVPHI